VACALQAFRDTIETAQKYSDRTDTGGQIPMLHVVRTTLALALLLLLSEYALAQTGKEEAKCSNSAVNTCENFEDRQINLNTDLWRAQYKNGGWGVSQPDCRGSGCSSVVSTPSGSPSFLGSKVLRFVTPANGTSGGFFDTGLPGAFNELFVRFYAMWCGKPVCSSDYVWSPVATKHVSFENERGTESALFWFPGGNSRAMQHFWYNTFNGPGEASSNARAQNVNGTSVVQLNTWYCLELRVRMNSTSSTHDGVMESWIDGVQHWNYQNQLISSSPTPNRMRGWGWYSYWNCDGNENCSQYPHPEIYRFADNLIISTQRIGCLQSSGDVVSQPSSDGVAPNMPSGVAVR
jgi:hypothetical protein